jgi:spermidine/putrescine transport system ATP-binding protein
MPEPLLTLSGIRKQFAGGVIGLDTIDLDIQPGEFLSLLGPSGCGKTTTLRVIAGFESPTAGTVRLDGRDITSLRPFDRPVNTVFQDYALFPHMDVADNIGFGLSLKRVASAERRKRVEAALEMVGLSDKIGARISELSGGQRQRVGLARAIVCEPRVLLLDEPLSALDAHLREQMQVELKRLQSRLRTTFVMVTHDQTEAMSISDRIVVMNKGKIEQIASPAELYDHPKTRFVASFIGTMNLLSARCTGAAGDSLGFDADGLRVTVAGSTTSGPQRGELATVGVRPEDVVISDAGDATVPARVGSVVFHGKTLRVHAEIGTGTSVVIDLPRQGAIAACRPGDVLHVSVRPGAVCPLLAA